MHWIDFTIFGIYLASMLGVGFYFLKKNKDTEDYFVGGRQMSSLHIGLSVVATDVGGGFSIGLGGLGFLMGISGSWLLFSGLIGAWLAAVILIPRVHTLSRRFNFLSFPQFLASTYNKQVALIAGIISAIGYLGFTSSQVLAGAKLASATFPSLSLNQALLVMGVIAVVYTVMGGLKAVIYTDTIQWIVLMGGLLFVGLPLCYQAVGGFEAVRNDLSHEFLSLTNVSWQQIVNWMITIIPIWFIGMTLYQRIYAARDQKTAQRAWFIAGLFEYPLMAFTGVLLGLFARVAFEDGMFISSGFAPGDAIDSEMGLPLLLKTVLPVGLTGIVLSAYFSAIMSTADSCLMAASGNVLTDILKRHNHPGSLRFSQILTLIIGILALLIAIKMPNVLELMLYSYTFMVSGLFIPVMAAIISPNSKSIAAFWSMIIGGGTSLILIILNPKLPFNLDANIFGISASLVVFILISIIKKGRKVSSSL
ncbi:sodium:solute symporter family protein [Sunxiuqinia sp. A32]|uniref:sodium:solute symporter family protein n=1 Tax=Sunxiuqinia sp. A32 TaxID=3461496 RepID=UPI004045C744